MKAEKLPPGFTRRASGSLRVQIRIMGHEPVVKNFPLSSTDPDERRRQMGEATAWASQTRLKMSGGTHVSTRLVEATTLRIALERFEAEALKGRKTDNVTKERYRIRVLLADPIADRRLAQLRLTDVAALRDRLIEAGWAKNVEIIASSLERRAVKAATVSDRAALLGRVAAIRSLPGKKRQSSELAAADRARVEAQIARIEADEQIRQPARTTVSNVVQIVSRVAKFMSQYMEGVPDLTGTPMPKATPGRERRVSREELEALLRAGPAVDARLPLIIRFAIATALRRERILSFSVSHLREIGRGRHAIVFPREQHVRTKRTGIVPVTSEIDGLIGEALDLKGKEGRTGAPIWGTYTIEGFKSAWRRLLAVTGILDLHFHDLRHEATSRLFERGLTTAEVMSITGHSTTDMVDRYSHYAATIVLEKLEAGLDGSALLGELEFLASQYRAQGGSWQRLLSAVSGEAPT